MPEGRSSASREPFNLKEGVLLGSEKVLTSIREINGNPNKVVRAEDLVDDDIDKSIAYYTQLKVLFEELRDSYGIAIPDIDMVIGTNKWKEKKLFMVVDKIEGKTLEQLQEKSDGVREKFETFYTNILRSMFNAYKENRPFFSDVKHGNIMYGHKSKESGAEDQFFVCDMGDGFWRRDQRGCPPEWYDEQFFRDMDHMVALMKEEEKHFSDNTVFVRAREQLKEIYQYLENTKAAELERVNHVLPSDFNAL